MASETKLNKDNEDKIRDMVESIYRNYGIEPENMDDGEIGRIVGHYKSGKADIESDYKKSLRHKGSFDDDGLI